MSSSTKPCSASEDGIHRADVDLNHETWRCGCGETGGFEVDPETLCRLKDRLAEGASLHLEWTGGTKRGQR